MGWWLGSASRLTEEQNVNDLQASWGDSPEGKVQLGFNRPIFGKPLGYLLLLHPVRAGCTKAMSELPVVIL